MFQICQIWFSNIFSLFFRSNAATLRITNPDWNPSSLETFFLIYNYLPIHFLDYNQKGLFGIYWLLYPQGCSKMLGFFGGFFFLVFGFFWLNSALRKPTGNLKSLKSLFYYYFILTEEIKCEIVKQESICEMNGK